MIKRRFCTIVVLVVISWLTAGPTVYALAASRVETTALPEPHAMAHSGLSSYWPAKVQQWSELILREAARRELDPDLLAALVWKESRGDASAVGPAGAAGLMQVMPKEAGFSWRPTRAALLDPETNLIWGTRTLSIIIRQSAGDIFGALAAYNGGWDQATYRGPQSFATSVLRCYVHAVARRHGLADDWTAILAVRQPDLRGSIWVAEASRDDLYLYEDGDGTTAVSPFDPGMLPTSIVASCADEATGTPCEIGLWVFDSVTQQWVGTHEPVVEPHVEQDADLLAGRPVPSVFVMAGSTRPGSSPAPTLASPGNATTPTPQEAMTPSLVDPSATMGPLTSAPAMASCVGGPLTLQAWPLERTFTAGTPTTPEGWKVRIYAEAHGGDCAYDYAWNDASDIRVVNASGSVTFEVTSTRRDAPILGTVVVLSGDRVQRARLYIHPPD